MATIRDNVVILKGNIKEVRYVDGSAKATKGQPFDAKPSITVKDGVATILFRSGRKKSKPIADTFIEQSRSMYAYQGGSGGRPKELNFMFSVDVVFDDNTVERVNLGQGSNIAFRNNWWVGFDNIKVSGMSMRTAIGKTFDQVKGNLPEPFNHVADAIGKVFGKDFFNAVNMFVIEKK